MTKFFRDGEAFDALERQVREMVKRLGNDRSIRVWSVGTASGEEAYTIAIILSEVLGDRFGDYDIQILASDIDEKALAVARRGHYPHSALRALPAPIREKYFTRFDAHYEIQKRLRAVMLFSRHDISIDPPFLRIDLLVCRNLLIYFNADLQEEVLRLFHHAVKPEGILFLGKSENLSPSAGLFSRVDGKYKLFRREAGVSKRVFRFGQSRRNSRLVTEDGRGGAIANKRESEGGRTVTDRAREAYFAGLPHPYVVINRERAILEVSGSIRLYAEIKSEPEASLNLIRAVNPELSLDLRGLITKAETTGERQRSYVIHFALFGNDHYVRLVCQHARNPTGRGYPGRVPDRVRGRGARRTRL